jgi:hypothetical protein
MIALLVLTTLLGGAAPQTPAEATQASAPDAAVSPMRQRLRRVPLGPRIFFGLGVSSLGVGGISLAGGGIILAGDHTTAVGGTQEHSLYGGQVASANDFGYVGQAVLGVGVVALATAVIWGVLATRGGP